MALVGQKLVAENLLKVQDGFIRTVNKTMKNVADILNKKIEDNISLDDHSLEDLRKLGHPYARRSPVGIHTPSYQVHKQSGRLKDSQFSGTTNAQVLSGKLEATAYAGLDANRAKHAEYIIFGTSKMIPRPVLEGSKQEVYPQARELIGKNLKNLVSNFKGK